MMWKEKWTALLVLLAFLVAPWVVPRAPAIEGIPFDRRQIVFATAPTSLPSDLCRQGKVAGAQETKALLQVQTNGIYYVLDTGATYPLTTNGALIGNVGDIIEVVFPSKFSGIRQGNSMTSAAEASVTCFQ